MNRLTELEVWYDDHTLLVGDVLLVESISGKPAVEIEKFSIVAYLGNIDYDVTKAFMGRQLDHFKDYFRERASEQIGELQRGRTSMRLWG